MRLAVLVGSVVGVFLVSAAIGVWSAETGRRRIQAVFKPLTTILLLAVVGGPGGRFAWLIDLGIVFSLAGDVALLSATRPAFLAGLASFLLAHISYTAAFVLVSWSPLWHGARSGWAVMFGTALVMAAVTVLLLRKLWPGTAGLRGPMVGYSVALAAMVVGAVGAAWIWTRGPVGAGPGALPTAALGAVAFYVSDASLAVNRFARPIKHAPLLTLGLYWLGQLGIALAARFATS
jgi:uncharacterized membrane protein YhhN